MQARGVLLRDAALGALLALASSTAAGEEPLKVTKLRLERVTLFDCADGTKKSEYARKDFQGAWPIVPSSTALPAGLLRVQVGAEQYCVRAYTVETNKPISASGECGAVVAAAQPKSASTRGLGEACK